MISVSRAKQLILKNTKVLPSEKVDIKYAVNRVLADNIKSSIDIPSFDNAAMDGYAVKAEFTTSATKSNPVIFDIIEEITPGIIPKKRIKERTAVAITTGSIIPKGCNCVIMKEDTRRDNNKVFVYKEYKKDENIRHKGEDVKKGEVILKKGTILSAPEIGMLAQLGYTKVNVYKMPQVGILSTGNEIIEPHQKLTQGKVRNSNAYSLYSLIKQSNAEPIYFGIAKDDEKEITERVKAALSKVDILITTAGVSVSEYDIVKEVINKLATIKFYQVAIRPGKPTLFAVTKDNKLIFGLPGNPVSAIITFLQFVKIAILLMQNIKYEEFKIKARLKNDIKKKKGLRYFLRGVVEKQKGEYFVSLFPHQGSAILKSLVIGNCLVEIGEGIEYLNKGEEVEVVLL